MYDKMSTVTRFLIFLLEVFIFNLVAFQISAYELCIKIIKRLFLFLDIKKSLNAQK